MTAESARKQAPDLGRREVMLAGAALGCGLRSAITSEPAAANAPATAPATPLVGDGFVLDGVGPAPASRVTAEMLAVGGKPLAVVPCDPTTGAARSGSRFLKLMLVRVDPADLDPETRAVAADGIVAFSAICTHQGCTLTGWNAEHKALSCFCHHSEFSAIASGKVLKGPAKRRLPMLPLTAMPDGTLAVAGSFTAKPGMKA